MVVVAPGPASSAAGDAKCETRLMDQSTYRGGKESLDGTEEKLKLKVCPELAPRWLQRPTRLSGVPPQGGRRREGAGQN